LGRVVYRKEINLNYNGAHNLLSEAYQGEPWLGDVRENYPGVKNKLVKCFPNFGNVRAYVFQAKDLDEVFAIKENVRQIFNIGKHAIHITDTQEETLRLARLVFNENAVHFLNYARPNRIPDFRVNANKFKTMLKDKSLDERDYVLDSGLVMAAYGIRRSNDIDYITTSSELSDELVENHKEDLIFHGLDEIELVDNPRFHFWFKDVKYVSLSQVYAMKTRRNDQKDRLDASAIRSLVRKSVGLDLSSLKYALYFKRAKLIAKIAPVIIRDRKS